VNLDNVPGDGKGTEGLAIYPRFTGHTGEVRSVSFAPGGGYVLTGSNDKTARLWDAKTRKLLLTFSDQITSPVVSVAFSSDGKYALAGGEDGKVGQWDLQKRTGSDTPDTPDSPFRFTYASGLKAIVFGPNDNYTLTANADG